MSAWKKTQHAGRGVLCMKVAMRLALLPPRQEGQRVQVLDAYAGNGDIWRAVSRWRDDLEITSIELDQRRGRGAIHGDNRRIMAAMDMTRFDVVDLDAWGQPTDQLAIALDRGFTGVLFWTFIATYPRGSNLLLDAADIPREWAAIAPSTMFSQGGVFRLWQQFLAVRGFRQMAIVAAGQGRYYGCVGFADWSLKRYEGLLKEVVASGVGARFGAPMKVRG